MAILKEGVKSCHHHCVTSFDSLGTHDLVWKIKSALLYCKGMSIFSIFCLLQEEHHHDGSSLVVCPELQNKKVSWFSTQPHQHHPQHKHLSKLHVK